MELRHFLETLFLLCYNTGKLCGQKLLLLLLLFQETLHLVGVNSHTLQLCVQLCDTILCNKTDRSTLNKLLLLLLDAICTL